MSRDMVDRSASHEGLVAAAGIEGQLAGQPALEVDHADALIGDQELHRAA